MAAYRCPVCGTDDTKAYTRCYHPGCPDGRDRGHPDRPLFAPHSYPTTSHDKTPPKFWTGFFVGIFFSFVLYFVIRGII